MHNRQKLFFLLLLAICADQVSKYFAMVLLSEGGNVSILAGTVQFIFTFNPSGFLSVLQGVPEQLRFILLNICVAVLLLGCLYYIFLYPQSKKHYCLPLTWVCAGGLSNLLDRMLHEEGVIDFVSIGIGSFRTGIFNLADVYILTGSFYLGYLILGRAQNSR